ncbi:MAG: hypothetical protein IKP88_08735 [Lachnospiraceae bacterium]|nr:hypothetical protein [Lachnospiraceae bacterium]
MNAKNLLLISFVFLLIIMFSCVVFNNLSLSEKHAIPIEKSSLKTPLTFDCSYIKSIIICDGTTGLTKELTPDGVVLLTDILKGIVLYDSDSEYRGGWAYGISLFYSNTSTPVTFTISNSFITIDGICYTFMHNEVDLCSSVKTLWNNYALKN